MSTTVYITIRMNALDIINNGSDMPTAYKLAMAVRDWCIIELDTGTWEISNWVMENIDFNFKYTKACTFANSEDATAFKLIFSEYTVEIP